MRKTLLPALAVAVGAVVLAPSTAMALEGGSGTLPVATDSFGQAARHCTSNQENIPVAPGIVLCGSYVLVTDPEHPRI